MSKQPDIIETRRSLLKPFLLATVGSLVLVVIPASADNPTQHLSDKAETLFNPADDHEVARLLEKENPRYPGYDRDEQQPGSPIVRICLGATRVEGRLLEALKRLTRLRSVFVSDVDANQLNALAELRGVERLAIGGRIGAGGRRSTFEGEELKPLASMPRLRELNLPSAASMAMPL